MSLALMDSYNPTVQALQRENKKLRAENKKLVLAIADHVTVRAEQRQEIKRLAGDVMFWREKYAEVEAELAEAKADAERYQWLRHRTGASSGGFHNIYLPELPANWQQGSIAQHLDAAIDAAMKGK